MSRRRPARNDDPAPSVDLAQTAAATAGDQPCPGPCNADWRRAEHAAAELAETRAARHRDTHHAGAPCPDDCTHHEPVPQHGVPFHPGRPIWCVDVPAFNDKGEMLDRLEHRGCTRLILTKLRDLPDLATALTPGRLTTPRDADIDHGSTSHGGARSLAHAPSPSPGWDTADELIRWAVDLEDWLRRLIRDPRPSGRVPAIIRVRHHTVPLGHLGPTGPTLGHRGTMTAPAERTFGSAITYLHRHATPLLATPDARQIGQDILDTHRRLEHLVGHDRLVHRITEPCPRCGRKGLRRKDGSELVRCTYCPAVWDWEHLPHLARVYADSVQAKGAGA